MRSRMLVLPLLLSVAFIGCGGDTQADAEEGMEQAAPPPPPVEPSHTLTFEAVKDATASGTLVVTERTDGATDITVELDGLAPGDHAWHVHQAACGSDGPIVLPFTDIEGQQGIAQPLVANDQGHATATVMVRADQLARASLTSGQYSIHVHEGSGPKPGASVACVTLR